MEAWVDEGGGEGEERVGGRRYFGAGRVGGRKGEWENEWREWGGGSSPAFTMPIYKFQ